MNDALYEDYDDIIAPNLCDDAYATQYLNMALEDSDPRHFLLALQRVAKAREINMTKMASQANMTRQGLYQALSEKGNPEWATLSSLIDMMGYQFSLQPKKAG